MARLSNQNRYEILKECTEGTTPKINLAKQYGVTEATIYNSLKLCKREHWDYRSDIERLLRIADEAYKEDYDVEIIATKMDLEIDEGYGFLVAYGYIGGDKSKQANTSQEDTSQDETAEVTESNTDTDKAAVSWKDAEPTPNSKIESLNTHNSSMKGTGVKVRISIYSIFSQLPDGMTLTKVLEDTRFHSYTHLFNILMDEGYDTVGDIKTKRQEILANGYTIGMTSTELQLFRGLIGLGATYASPVPAVKKPVDKPVSKPIQLRAGRSSKKTVTENNADVAVSEELAVQPEEVKETAESVKPVESVPEIETKDFEPATSIEEAQVDLDKSVDAQTEPEDTDVEDDSDVVPDSVIPEIEEKEEPIESEIDEEIEDDEFDDEQVEPEDIESEPEQEELEAESEVDTNDEQSEPEVDEHVEQIVSEDVTQEDVPDNVQEEEPVGDENIHEDILDDSEITNFVHSSMNQRDQYINASVTTEQISLFIANKYDVKNKPALSVVITDIFMKHNPTCLCTSENDVLLAAVACLNTYWCCEDHVSDVMYLLHAFCTKQAAERYQECMRNDILYISPQFMLIPRVGIIIVDKNGECLLK